MTDVINDEKAAVDLDAARPQAGGASDELVRQLAERARAEGLRLTGEGGLLSQLTKVVVESIYIALAVTVETDNLSALGVELPT